MSQTFPPSEITLPLGPGKFLFRLRAVHIARLQQARGWKVTLPDGGTYIKPKPLGLIWREQMTGEYDPLDCREVLLQGLIGGATGSMRGEPVVVNPITAEDLLIEHFDPIPTENQWDLARSVLVATCQGFDPPADGGGDGEGEDSGNAPGAGTDTSTSPGSSATA